MHRVVAVSFMILTGLLSFRLVTANHPPPGRRVESPGETDALRAFDWWYNQRALPQGLIPNNALMKASEELSHMMPKQRHRRTFGSSGYQWHSLGPDNVGGRVLSIAVNPKSPNIVWAGSASGGLWKSTTAG